MDQSTKAQRAFEKAFAKALREPKPRRKRAKSEADIWYEQMLAEFKKNGAEHLASAKAKIEGK